MSDIIQLDLYEEAVLQLEWYVGVPGEAATAAVPTLSVVAGQPISAGRFVVVENGQVFYYDPNRSDLITKPLGISITAAITGTPCVVQSSGKVTIAGWGLTPNALYFANANGVISTTPSTQVSHVVGYAYDANSLIINAYTPIILQP
jgi:hypothetical protein